MLRAACAGIKLLEVCLSIHEVCFMSDSSFVVKFVLTKIMIKAARDSTGGSAALILFV